MPLSSLVLMLLTGCQRLQWYYQLTASWNCSCIHDTAGSRVSVFLLSGLLSKDPARSLHWEHPLGKIDHVSQYLMLYNSTLVGNHMCFRVLTPKPMGMYKWLANWTLIPVSFPLTISSKYFQFRLLSELEVAIWHLSYQWDIFWIM